MVTADGDGLAFVLSTPRAGSTLLAATLGSHSEILCPPEPWLLLPLASVRGERILATAAFDFRLAMQAMHEFLTPRRFDEALGAFALAAYNSALAESNRRILVEKTPRYYQILPELETLFPRALNIWMQRNPLDTIASCMDTWKLPIDELLGESISPYTFDVTISFRLLADHFARKRNQMVCLRYEDFVREPRPHVEEICRRLNVEFEPGMLDYRANTSLMRTYRSASMGDKKVLDASAIHVQSIDRWRTELTPTEVLRILHTLGSDIFQDLGYANALVEACAYAGVQPSTILPAGRLAELLDAYASYGISHASMQGDNNDVPRPDVQYTLLGQRTDELGKVAQERLDLIHELDRLLRAQQADACEKERVIAELRTASEERLQLIHELEGQVQSLRGVVQPDALSGDRPDAPGSVGAGAETELGLLQLELEAKERTIQVLQAASDERLQLIERLDEELQAASTEITRNQALQAKLDRARADLGDLSAQLAEAQARTPSAPPADHYALLATILEEQSVAIGALEQGLEALQSTRVYASQDTLEERVHSVEMARDVAEALADVRLTLIDQQRHKIEAFRRWRPSEIWRSWTAPSLGVLYQYPPRRLHVPAHYMKPARKRSMLRMSIVTPSLNQGAFIERTIRSVLAQNYADLEYIVQDGASTDGTPAVLERYANFFHHCESEPDTGFGNGINRGFAHASGEIMAYLNSDDILLPGALHHVAQFFETHPEVDVVYGHRAIIDEYDAEVGRWVLPAHDDEVLSWADYVPQETLFWRRRIWEQSGGGIDESFRFAIDWDLLLRFREAGARMVRLPRFLGGFRVHPHQKTSSEMSHVGMQEMSRLRERCHARPVSDEEVHRAIQGYLRRHVWHQRLYRLGVLRY